MNECLFCRIIERKIPAQIVAENEELLAFNDINPQAPTHVLLVPKIHIPTLADLTADNAAVMSQALLMANRLAAQHHLLGSGYRVVVNCGSGAGQSVFHLHLHVLGGRRMTWPPG